MDDISYENFKLLYPKITALDCTFPPEIQITTHTLIYKFPLTFYTKYIAEHIPLDPDFVNIIKYGNSTRNFRSLVHCNKKKSVTANTKKKSKKRKNFYFQTTLVITHDNTTINVKLFRNGTIQVTGSKNLSFVFWCVYKILSLFSNEKENNYATPFYNCTLTNIIEFKVVMINCVFNIEYEINKNNTYSLLNDIVNSGKYPEFVSCNYDPLRHSGIIMKYKTKNSLLSLILFEEGSIIMSGAICYSDIIKTYKFINLILLDNYLQCKK